MFTCQDLGYTLAFVIHLLRAKSTSSTQCLTEILKRDMGWMCPNKARLCG
jgi:hypothetical protein